MNLKNILLILIVLLVAIAAGSWVSSNKKVANKEAVEAARARFSNIQGNILSPARKITIPYLQQHDGAAFTAAVLQGHWSIFFFGFTHCSEVCPLAMSVLAQAKKLAEAQSLTFPKVYLVSVDQERDDLKSLAKFVSGFDKSFTGVTGDPKLIKALALQMSVFYAPAEKIKGDENYQIGHSAAMLFLNPEGKLKAFLNPPHTAEKLLQDIATVKKLPEESQK